MLIWLFASVVGCGGSQSSACPEGMVLIPAGRTQLGVEAPRPYQEPARSEDLAAFCIDTYEYPNQAGQPAQARVTWNQAQEACAAGGKRLCRSAEWERACRGAEGRRYSYGAERDASACNTPIEGSGPGPEGPPPTKAGGWPRCRSPEGVYDLDGSLSEWVSDPWSGPPETFRPEAVVDPTRWRTLRGGTMWAQTFYGQDCLSRHGHEVSFHNMDDGFRCCRDAL